MATVERRRASVSLASTCSRRFAIGSGRLRTGAQGRLRLSPHGGLKFSGRHGAAAPSIAPARSAARLRFAGVTFGRIFGFTTVKVGNCAPRTARA
jgi:hypothetical protein